MKNKTYWFISFLIWDKRSEWFGPHDIMAEQVQDHNEEVLNVAFAKMSLSALYDVDEVFISFYIPTNQRNVQEYEQEIGRNRLKIVDYN